MVGTRAGEVKGGGEGQQGVRVKGCGWWGSKGWGDGRWYGQLVEWWG